MDVTPTTQAGSAFQRTMDVMLEAGDGIAAIAEHYLDGDGGSRSVAGQAVLSLDELGERLMSLPPEKRIREIPSNERSAKSLKTTTLEQDMSKLTQKIQRKLAAIQVDTSAAETLPWVSKAAEGYLLVDDEIIDTRTLMGRVYAESLNALARGDNLDNISRDLSNLSKNLHSSNRQRSIFDVDTPRWKNDRVLWDFGSIEEGHRQAIYDAMSDWENKTKGAIDFQQAPFSAWDYFLISILVKSSLTIESKALKHSDASGSSNLVGAWGGPFHYLQLRPGLSGNQLYRTSRHELGHVLGLNHEQQRPDRDDFLDNIDASNSQNRKFAWYKWRKELRVRFRSVKVWFFYLPYPVFYLANVRGAWRNIAGGPFDARSVMLYPKLKFKEPDGGWKKFYSPYLSGEDLEFYRSVGEYSSLTNNKEISPLDVRGILQVY